MKALFFVVNEDKQNLKSGNIPWWKPGMEIFGQVSIWIVVPMILALAVGKSLDARYETRPVIFLVFAGIGFLFTCVGIIRVIKSYIKKLKDIEKDGSR